mgnify:CR=1 FL=1
MPGLLIHPFARKVFTQKGHWIIKRFMRRARVYSAGFDLKWTSANGHSHHCLSKKTLAEAHKYIYAFESK